MKKSDVTVKSGPPSLCLRSAPPRVARSEPLRRKAHDSFTLDYSLESVKQTISRQRLSHQTPKRCARPYVYSLRNGFYTDQVTNTGNVDLTTVSVSDITADHNCGVLGALVAGSNVSCTGSFSLTWSEINAGVKTTFAT